ncbi:ATP-binding protein [Roseateles oligotrophus]|uniref:Adenylate/guanylate cyclase domain-containing protein n=1 Tax=Roseateles oligotrophus TaxID=1769250 RepID=A0ABT2YE70_9BURK|nr:adenylate/guanylate cyclase domain-containing protein [Roseateles oligotrophus]MCV2368322.1 adenylate/guanylate cyclase domain-containing protein [Roseateles oligotrophus]
MSEIRALLLTDVVDSTKMSEKLGDQAMAEVWIQHDRVARDLLPIWHGREIDKTDGMLLLFERADDAVRYAYAYHQALDTLPVPLKARAGLHVGPVILRENSAEDVLRGAKPLEVEGLAKPTAARIMSVAGAGQTLLSAEARAALPDSELLVESRGHWMMKGVSEPLELFEVAVDATQFCALTDGEKVYRVIRNGERWLPVKEIPNNLPQQLSNFVGREQELRDIKDLLGSARLVTLLGMGGLGKTRLSLQAAAELMHRFPDGVWFLDLAPITDPALALSEAAQVLGVREEPDCSLLQSVCAHLKHLRVLMIFDNCEHLIKPAAALAHAIVRAAPHVRLAASSREALNIPGERAYPIMPLKLPPAGASLATLMASPAVRLFVDRAQAHKASFELDEAQAPAVAELVARLEGIPLALELAAARVRALSVAEINRRLDDRYKLLTGGSRVLQERQQTLRALVDWSYDMLPEIERSLLQRLAVFRGGFDLEACEAVCGSEPMAPEDVLDLLTALIEKSLVMRIDGADESRYKMLETIRDYALEKLIDCGAAAQFGAAHCMYFFELSKQGRNGMRGPKQGEWLNRLEAEHDNLRAALGLAMADQGSVDPVVAVKLAVALQGFWILRGHASEGRAALQTMLQLPAVLASDMVHGFALYVDGCLAWSQSDHAAALAHLATCLELRRKLGKPEETAATLSTLAVARLSCGDADGAYEAALESLALFRDCAYRVGETTALLQLGQIETYLGHWPQAQENLQNALKLARQIKHPETEAEAELALAQLGFYQADMASAEAALARSLKICLSAGDRRGAANALGWQGKLDVLADRLPLARSRLAEALAAFNAFDMREQLLAGLEDHAALALRSNQASRAIALAAAAEQLRHKAGLPLPEHAKLLWQALREQLSAACQEEQSFQSAWQAGQGWDTAEALRQALALSLTAGQIHH